MDLTTKDLDKLWDSQAQDRKDICKRIKYYDGKHAICDRNARYPDGKKKTNIPTNFAAYIVDLYVGAITTVPYQVSQLEQGSEDTTSAYMNIARDAMIPPVDVEVLRSALTCGYGLELHEFIDREFRIVAESPENWALVRDEDHNIVAAITRSIHKPMTMFRGELLQETIEVMYLYDESRRTAWRRRLTGSEYQVKGEWEQVEVIQHYYGSVPLVEWYADKKRTPIINDAFIRQQDEYNDIDSLSGDDIRNSADAIMKTWGMSGDWMKQNIDIIQTQRILPLNDKTTDDAEYMVKTTDTQRIDTRLARCREAIHIMTGAPDIQQIVGVTGGTSGIALKLKFMPMEQRAGSMFKFLEECLRKRIDLLNSVSTKLRQTQITDYQVTMQVNVPVNRIEEWQNIGSLSGIVTRRTQLELLTDIKDPESELRQLEKEEVVKADTALLSESPEAQAAKQDQEVAALSTAIEPQIQKLLDTIADAALQVAVKQSKREKPLTPEAIA